MGTLEVGALLVDNSDSSATSSPGLFFALVLDKDKEPEICPKIINKQNIAQLS